MSQPIRHRPPSPRLRAGYTLIEALLLVTILGIVGVTVGQSLIAVADHTEGDSNASQLDAALVTQMEALRATWKTRGMGLVNSAITIGNTSYTLTTDVENAAPNGGGNQATFYSLSVQIGGRSIGTYVSN